MRKAVHAGAAQTARVRKGAMVERQTLTATVMGRQALAAGKWASCQINAAGRRLRAQGRLAVLAVHPQHGTALYSTRHSVVTHSHALRLGGGRPASLASQASPQRHISTFPQATTGKKHPPADGVVRVVMSRRLARLPNAPHPSRHGPTWAWRPASQQPVPPLQPPFL